MQHEISLFLFIYIFFCSCVASVIPSSRRRCSSVRPLALSFNDLFSWIEYTYKLLITHLCFGRELDHCLPEVQFRVGAAHCGYLPLYTEGPPLLTIPDNLTSVLRLSHWRRQFFTLLADWASRLHYRLQLPGWKCASHLLQSFFVFVLSLLSAIQQKIQYNTWQPNLHVYSSV